MASPEGRVLPSPPAGRASFLAGPALPSPTPSSTRTMDRSIARGAAAAFFSSRLGTPKRKRAITTETTTASAGDVGGGGTGGPHVKDIVTWLEATATSAGASASLSSSASSERRQVSTAFSISTAASAAVTSPYPSGSRGASASAPSARDRERSSTFASQERGARSPPRLPTPPTDGGRDGDGLAFAPELRINSLTGEEEYSLTLLHYRSFLHRPLARCLDAPPADPRVTARRTRASGAGAGAGGSSGHGSAATPRRAGEAHGHGGGQVPQSTSLQQLDRLMSDLARWFPLAGFDGEEVGDATKASLSPSPLRVKKKRSPVKTGSGDEQTVEGTNGFWDEVRAYLRIDEEELGSDGTTAVATPSSSGTPSSPSDGAGSVDAHQPSAPGAIPPAPLYTPPRPPTAIPPLLGQGPGLPRTPSYSFSSSCYSDSEDGDGDGPHAGRATPPSPSPAPPPPPPRMFTHSISGYIDAPSDAGSDAGQRHVSGDTIRAAPEQHATLGGRAVPASISKGHATWYSDSSSRGSGSIVVGLDGRSDAPDDRTEWASSAGPGGSARQEESSEDPGKPRSHFADIKADIDRLLAGPRR